MRGGVLTRGAAPPVPAAEARRSARKYIPVPGSAPAAGTSAGTPGGCRAEGVRIAPPATSVDWTSVPGRIPARLCRSKASRIPGSPDGRPVPSGTEDDRAPAPEGAGCSRKTSVRGSTPRPDRSSKDPRSGPERTVSMDQVTVQELIDASVHFGCRAARWNPKMTPVIHGRRKITRNLGGIREMNGMPGAMVVVDPAREANAVREARRMGVAVIGVLDTDCDPESVDIVIPGNDDALKSVRLLVEQLGTSVEEGSANHRERLASVGVAEKRDEALAPGDEPRPTRGQRLPEGMSTRIAGGGKASALLDPEDEGE